MDKSVNRNVSTCQVRRYISLKAIAARKDLRKDLAKNCVLPDGCNGSELTGKLRTGQDAVIHGLQ